MQQNKKTYYYQQPITLLRYLKRTLGTRDFDETYFKEGLKKENIYIESEKNKYQSALIVAFEHHDNLQLDFEQSHWDKLIEHSNFFYLTEDPYKISHLHAFLFYVEARNKQYKISNQTFSEMVKKVINPLNENHPVLDSTIKSIIMLDYVANTVFFNRIWPFIEDKKWLINYIESREEKEFFKHVLDNENIKAFREKEKLDYLIEKTKEVKPNKI